MDTKAILDKRKLPDKALDNLWERIIVPAEVKERLLAQAVIGMTFRKHLDPGAMPIHGLEFGGHET